MVNGTVFGEDEVTLNRTLFEPSIQPQYDLQVEEIRHLDEFPFDTKVIYMKYRPYEGIES